MTAPAALLRRYKLVSLALVLVGAGVAAHSVTLPLGSVSNPGAGAWPLVLGVALAGASLALALIERDPDSYEPLTRRTWLVAAALVAMGGFAVLFTLFGLTIASLVLSLVWLRFFAKESWALTAGLAVLFTVVFVGVFGVLLRVPMPLDPVLELITGA